MELEFGMAVYCDATDESMKTVSEAQTVSSGAFTSYLYNIGGRINSIETNAGTCIGQYQFNNTDTHDHTLNLYPNIVFVHLNYYIISREIGRKYFSFK